MQRQYLTLLMSLEVAAARMDAAEINSNRLLKLAQDQGDSASVVLATAEAANLLNLAGQTRPSPNSPTLTTSLTAHQ